MPRLALLLVFSGLLAILLTVLLVIGEATLPGRLPPLAAAALAALGGAFLVGGLFLIEPKAEDRPGLPSQSFSG